MNLLDAYPGVHVDKRYFAVEHDLCRRWAGDDGVTREEMYVFGSSWVVSARLSRAESETPGEVRPVAVAEVPGFLARQRERMTGAAPAESGHTFFAWVRDWSATAEDPHALIRTWTSLGGHEREERYRPGDGWSGSQLRDDHRRGRIDGEFVRITAEDAERIMTSGSRLQ